MATVLAGTDFEMKEKCQGRTGPTDGRLPATNVDRRMIYDVLPPELYEP